MGPGPRLMGADSVLSLEDRLPHGQDNGSILHSEEDKERALGILASTEEGRKRTEELFGRGVWDQNRKGAFGRDISSDGNQEEDSNVDIMFNDLINGDVDDDRRERDQIVTADSLEAERNAMDMEDSD